MIQENQRHENASALVVCIIVGNKVTNESVSRRGYKALCIIQEMFSRCKISCWNYMSYQKSCAARLRWARPLQPLKEPIPFCFLIVNKKMERASCPRINLKTFSGARGAVRRCSYSPQPHLSCFLNGPMKIQFSLFPLCELIMEFLGHDARFLTIVWGLCSGLP